MMNMSEVCLAYRAALKEVWDTYHVQIDRAAKAHAEILAKTGSPGKALKALLAGQKKARDLWTEGMTDVLTRFELLFASTPSGIR